MTTRIDNTNEGLVLKQRLVDLELENARLKEELEFLKTHPSIAQGIKGETLIATLVDGRLTAYSQSYDIATADGLRIEVKYSKLNQPMKSSPTRRWNWSKPLGWLDKGKDYHFLLLVGEKDPRYLLNYPDQTPYVYFLVPIQDVLSVMDKGKSVGGMVQITTNLYKLDKKRNRPKLLDFQVDYERIKPLIENAHIAQPINATDAAQ
ncbi:MAG: hypothetical protein CVU18_10640 [Betaproteobacteria bacterium HGW-Betaproteobacteria-12]|nr:MAG: hypothetical protein CVU18_10640 [Betaproteobacteria bacterium HGW-Betaproteobacteria-12]